MLEIQQLEFQYPLLHVQLGTSYFGSLVSFKLH